MRQPAKIRRMTIRHHALSIPDVQGAPDSRRIALDRVGIRGVRVPIRLADGDSVQSTVAMVDLFVRLPAQQKGAHMSRFVEVLGAHAGNYSEIAFGRLLQDMLARLEASEGRIDMRFPYFVEKAAPVSGVRSSMDYDVTFSGEVRHGVQTFTLEVCAPVTSLCPCSKEISAYGAHNQRSQVTLRVQTSTPMAIRELIRIAEEHASSELYSVLKRPDEKFVTERAYDNPKFVEDLVRDVAGELDRDPRVLAYHVEGENFESIHNHTAYAAVARDKRLAPA
jgi:GTP cyclohydrolase I